MTGTKKIGMPGHNGAYVPDYATRVYHNMATSLPLFSILYPAIRRYTVQGTRKSETPVDCQSLKRKGGLLNNLFRPVKQFVQTPLITGLFEAFSFALCSISFSIFAPKMVNKSTGKKSGTILPAGTGAVNTTSSNPPSPSKEVVQENVDGTPPPSRPPSPPPSPPPSLEASEWSIEIEELSDEPPPGIQVSKDKKEPRRARRSSSWSRMMNSFRRKKSKELKPEDLYKTGPVPDDISANSEVEVNEPEETETPKENGEPDEEEIQVEETAEEKLASEMLAAEAKANQSSQPKNRLSKMLSFGTFGRRKSILVEDEIKNDRLESENKENTKVKVDSKQEKKRESKSEAQLKADTTGKSDEAPDGESGEVQSDDKKKLNKKVKTKEKKTKKTLKEKSDTKNQMETQADVEVISPSAENPDGQDSKKTQPFERSKSNQKFMFNFKSLSKSVDHVKPEPVAVDAIEVHEPDTDSDRKSEPVGVKPKRKTIADFFKREKSSKVNEAPTNSEPVPENLKKGGRFRSSFGRRAKAKSTEVDTTVNEETIQVESNKKPRRSTSMVFGSSFSLKKMFQNDPATDSSEQNSANKVPGILTKRGKRQSNSPRPKSVQLDDKPREFDHVPVELRSSRGTIGERFITFTRESLRIKKRQRSVSVDEGAAAVDKILEPPEIVPENQEPITDVADDVELVMEIRTDDTEIKAEIESEAEITTTTVIPSALHADFEPKHGIPSAWSSILRLYCVHETFSCPVFDVLFCFVCVLCLISGGFLVAASLT